MCGSDPLDQDLAVQIQRVRHSNHARPLGIGRRGGLSARVRRHWVAGDEQSGATGAYSGRGLAVEHHRGMRNPPGVLARLGEVLGGVRKDGGGSARRSSPACARSSVSSLGAGRDRVSECVWCKSTPDRGLRGVLLRSSALARAEQRYVRRRRTSVWCSGS